MNTSYDAIVIGCGGVGSAALYHLAKSGAKVIGLDRFPGGHDRGSSHGDTRIIRQAYFEHPDYTPLLIRAYALWSDLAEAIGEQLYFEVGLLEVGPADGIVIPGVLNAARQHGLSVDHLTAEEANYRFPQFHTPAGWQAVFEQHAGYLLVERCVLAHLKLAAQCGAEVRDGVSVLGWRPQGEGVVVETSAGEIEGRRLVIAAGAWAADLLSHLALKLEVRQKHLHWRPAPAAFSAERCPTFFFETPVSETRDSETRDSETQTNFFYGFPQLDQRGLKVAEHTHGEVLTDPLNASREPDKKDTARVSQFLAKYLPGAAPHDADHATCFYTMSADEHFLVGRHPRHEQVSFAAGLSGHGFKFTGVLGEALKDLALNGSTDLPIQFLDPARSAAKD